MKIFVDTHTHLWDPDLDSEVLRYFKDTPVQKMLSAEALLEAMDQNGIDLALVAALPYKADLSIAEVDAINQHLEKEIAKSSGRLKAYFTLNPSHWEHSQRVLDRYIDHPGFVGLKIHGPFQELAANDRLLFPIYERLEKKNKPVLFHSGGIGVKGFLDHYGDVDLFDETCTRFPDLPVILGHAGRMKYEEVAIVMRKHKNVYAEISTNFSKNPAFGATPLKRLIETLQVWVGDYDRVIFGSDYPFYSQEYTLGMVRTVEEIELIKVLQENTYQFCKNINIL